MVTVLLWCIEALTQWPGGSEWNEEESERGVGAHFSLAKRKGGSDEKTEAVKIRSNKT